MGGGTSVPLRAAERIDRERARELAGDAFSEDTFDRLCGADGRITADQLHTLAIALAPLQAGHAVFAAVLEADENRAYLEDAANELSAGAAPVRGVVEFSLPTGDDELAARRLDSVCAAIARASAGLRSLDLSVPTLTECRELEARPAAAARPRRRRPPRLRARAAHVERATSRRRRLGRVGFGEGRRRGAAAKAPGLLTPATRRARRAGRPADASSARGGERGGSRRRRARAAPPTAR